MGRTVIAAILVTLVCEGCGAPEVKSFRRVVLHDDVSPSDPASEPDEFALLGIHAPEGWTETPIVLRVPVDLPREAVDGFKRAAKTWNDAVGFDLLRLGESAPDDYQGDLYGRLDLAWNLLSFENHWCRTGKPPAVLATTIWDNVGSDTHKISRSDIVFNSTHYRITDALNSKDDGGNAIVDAESLALHELGHLLGLSHVSSVDFPHSVMTSFLFIGEGLANRELDPSDVERVRYVYVPGASRPPPGTAELQAVMPQRRRPDWGKTAQPSGGTNEPAVDPLDCRDFY